MLSHSICNSSKRVVISIPESVGVCLYPRAGTYECGFTSRSISHTAKADLKVALLPDIVTLLINPLTVDCSLDPPTVDVNVMATISHSEETFHVWGSYMGEWIANLGNKCKANPKYSKARPIQSSRCCECVFLYLYSCWR